MPSQLDRNAKNKENGEGYQGVVEGKDRHRNRCVWWERRREGKAGRPHRWSKKSGVLVLVVRVCVCVWVSVRTHAWITQTFSSALVQAQGAHLPPVLSLSPSLAEEEKSQNTGTVAPTGKPESTKVLKRKEKANKRNESAAW